MKLYKKFDWGQWNVHAFEEDGSQDSFITSEMLPITEAEADAIRLMPPSDEYKERMQQQLDALGRIKRWPPREFKEALGQLCVSSASLESTMRTLIWAAAGLGSDTGMIFTGGKKSGSELSEMLKLLIKQRAPDLMKPVDCLLVEISKSFSQRGIYVHSVWTVGENGTPFIGKFFSEKTPKEGRQVTLDDLEKLAISFGDLEGKLAALILHRFAV